jgi:hypothetical protein
MYHANPEHFAMQMAVFDRMREINAAARPAPVNATRESRRVAAPRGDAARAFAPGGLERQLPYPRGVIDLRRLTRN